MNKETDMSNAPKTEEKEVEGEVVSLPLRGSAPLTAPTVATIARVAPLELEDEVIKIIRESRMPGASEAEFRAFIEVCKARRLHPLLGQIHPVKRMTKVKDVRTGKENWVETWAWQTGIDGFRVIAQRTGEYDGQDEPEYECDKTGWPLVARVRVYRKGISRPFVGVAHFEEFKQTTRDGALVSMWAKMPRGQLGKCAEAQGIRRAFPEDLSGLYIPEELGTDVPLEERQGPPVSGGASVAVPRGAPVEAESQQYSIIAEAIGKADSDAKCVAIGRDMLVARRLKSITGAQENKLKSLLNERRTQLKIGTPREPAPPGVVSAEGPSPNGPVVTPPPAPASTPKADAPKGPENGQTWPVCGDENDGCRCTRPKGHDEEHFEETTGAVWGSK